MPKPEINLLDREFWRSRQHEAWTWCRANDPVYLRIESSLMVPMEGLPKLEKGDSSKPRLFNLRTYESHNERASKKKIEMFNKGELAIFRRVVFPNLLPAVLSGVALAFARAIGEFGAVVLISGNRPFKTEVASLYIFGRVNTDPAGAAALSVELLVISLAVLLSIGGTRRWATRHDR